LDPPVPCSDDSVGIGAPDEGLCGLVVLADVAVDGDLEIDDRPEHSVFEPPAGQNGEEALHRVQPGTGGGREVEGTARVIGGATVPPGRARRGEPSPRHTLSSASAVVWAHAEKMIS